MANHKIVIEGIDPNDRTKLILSVKKKFTNNLKVKPGDKVLWKIGKYSDVASISIKENESSTNVFSKGPKEIKKSKNWNGTVDSKITVPNEEIYTINFKPIGSKEIHHHDPKISVNP